MKPNVAMAIVFVFGSAFCVALWVLGGCVQCATPNCSDLPPEPSPWVETVTKDASYER